LKNSPENVAILTIPYSDYLAFSDAETWDEYAIHVWGSYPFLITAKLVVK